jgi:hypothetical protein
MAADAGDAEKLACCFADRGSPKDCTAKSDGI